MHMNTLAVSATHVNEGVTFKELKNKILSSTNYCRFPLNITLSSRWQSDLKDHFLKRETYSCFGESSLSGHWSEQ